MCVAVVNEGTKVVVRTHRDFLIRTNRPENFYQGLGAKGQRIGHA